MGCSKSNSKREVYSNPGISQGRKVSNNLPTYHLNRRDKVQSEQMKGNDKDQRRNKIETGTIDQILKDKTDKPLGQGDQ